jgi:hypothetical protein
MGMKSMLIYAEYFEVSIKKRRKYSEGKEEK